jgi:hypothetical protein
MQKLSGKSINKLYKSYIFFTRIPTKLSLHFSGFLKISMEFTSFSKIATLIKILVFNQAPRSFPVLTYMPLVHNIAPGKNQTSAIGSSRR